MADDDRERDRARRRARSRSRATTRHGSAPKDDDQPVAITEFAWRVNDGLNDWTSRVDGKASIALATEAVVFGLVVLLATGDGELAHTTGLTSLLLGAGVVALGLSVAWSVAVVFPQLRGFSTRKEFKDNVIYFGHLRHWDPDKLREHLISDPRELAGLSRQLVRVSKIVWRKHRWLQASLAMFMIGVLLVAGALVHRRAVDSPGSGGVEVTDNGTMR